jgi:type II secretory pathway pseudopilin PulG
MVNQKRVGFMSLLILLVLSLVSVSALSIDMKDSFQKQETGLAKITGASYLSSMQILFYRGNSEVALENGLVKIGETYYAWFVTPDKENNYSISLSDVQTLNGKQSTSKNFTVFNGTSSYYIKPGAISIDKSFSISLFSNNEVTQTISTNYPVSRNISMSPGSNQIDFQFNETNNAIKSINLGIYVIPVYFIVTDRSENVIVNRTATSVSNLTNSIDVSPKKIDRVESKIANLTYTIQIINNGSSNISNLMIDYNSKVFKLSQSSIDFLPVNGSVNLNLSVISNNNLSEVLFVKKENYSLAIPIQIERVESNQSNNRSINVTSNLGLYDCVLELQGQQCLPEQSCTKNTSISRQGSCCLGSCYYPEKTGSSSWIGWLIAIIVLGIIGYLIWRYKMVAPVGNPIENQVKEIEKKEIEKKAPQKK